MERPGLIRRIIVLGCLGLFALAIVWRYAGLALATPSGAGLAPRVVQVRGSIHDRSGRLLAVDTDLYDVSVWKPALDSTRQAEQLGLVATSLQLDAAELVRRVDDVPNDFLYLARRIDSDTVRQLIDLIEANGIVGINIDRVAGRVYPEKNLAAQLIGFVGTDNTGLAGAEAAFENDLRADPAGGRAGFAYGNSVFLTIDVDIQFRLEQICREAMAENVAEAVVMVALEARTGKVLAYISLPDFDLNHFLDADQAAWTDRVSIYTYEPGSVFKVFSLASLLSLGGIDQASSFICDGSFERATSGGETITIRCLGTHGQVNLTKILEYSCNAGAAGASETVTTGDFYQRLNAFGFGQRPGADRPSESSGLFRDPDSWSARSKPTIAMGQEILVTAMQMASAATVLANEGTLLRPRTLEAVYSHSGELLMAAPVVPQGRFMTAEDARIILDAMEAVTLESGTGRRARIDDLRMSVKTGTAQMIDPATRRYSDDDFIASTLALFPSEDPQYIVYTAIIKPRGESIYGGRIAAPLIREAALLIADLYGTARGTTPVATHSGRVVLSSPLAIDIGGTMPDLSGVPKRLLTSLLTRRDLIIDLQGDGYVAEQSPAPGTPVESGMTIVLRLR